MHSGAHFTPTEIVFMIMTSTVTFLSCVLDAQTQNGDEPVGEYSFLGQSCLSSADSC